MSSSSLITSKAFDGKTRGRWVTRYKGITFHRNEKREFWRIKRINKNIRFETDRGKGVSLKEDLAKFEQWDAWLSRGVNPLKAEQAEREAQDRALGDTFKGHAKQWLEMKIKELKPTAINSHNNYRRYIAYANEEFGDKRIGEISPKDVATLLKRHESTPEQVNRMRGAVEAILDRHHVFNGSRNPAELKVQRHYVGNLVKRAKSKKQSRIAMHYRDAPAFFAELQHGVSLSHMALELFCLTLGSRNSGLLKAKWCDIDFEANTWLVPKENHKVNDWRTHLTGSAISCLERLAEFTNSREGYLFPSASPLSQTGYLSDTSLRKTWKRHTPAGINGEPHTDIMGFRATFYSWGKDSGFNADHLRMQRGADPEDDEASLSYIRTDAYEGRKAIITQWEDFLLNG